MNKNGRKLIMKHECSQSPDGFHRQLPPAKAGGLKEPT